jgi:hypothetical protein
MSILDEMVPSSTEKGVDTGEGITDFEAVRKRIFGSKGKSTKRKSADPPVEETSKEIEKIFAGENWEEVASLYFNARFAITGWDGFQLTDAQKKTLGLSLSTTMKMLLKIDPGYIALIVFTTNFGGLIAQKEMIYKKLLKEFKEREKNGKIAS